MEEYRNFTGKYIKDIKGLEVDSDYILIEFEDGTYIKFYHDQDCCEFVRITQVDNDVSRHIGAMFLRINEKIVDDYDNREDPDGYDESATATFYDIVTTKGFLSFRWVGESNGYYSESVDIYYGDEG